MVRRIFTDLFRPKNILAFIFKEERRSSVALLVTTASALFIANSPWSGHYFELLNHHLTVGSVTLDVRHWINEALMALFFLVVGIEVKRELIDGELRTWKRAAFPLFAAIGGMIVPALIFTMFNPFPPESRGWGIPMATDIAIAIGVLALLGTKVPRSLRVFLLSLAIIDDIGSIVIIGIFYNQPTNMFALLLAIILSIGLAAARSRKLWPLWFLIIGTAILYCLLLAGVSGTLAGVVVALMMPLTTRRLRSQNIQVAEFIEDLLIPVTSFIVVPLFVFANAGLQFSGISLSSSKGGVVFLGVFLGLVLGKPLGILGTSWLVDTLRIADKPRSINWQQIAGIGCLAGIGFTISLLITDLAFKNNDTLMSYAMLGIFLASVLSGCLGLMILRTTKVYSKHK